MYTTYEESLRDQLEVTYDEAIHEARKHGLETEYAAEHAPGTATTGDQLANWLGY